MGYGSKDVPRAFIRFGVRAEYRDEGRGIFVSPPFPSQGPPNHPRTTERPSARRALVGRKLPNPCSSDSQSEHVRWSYRPRRRRGRSSTTTSGPSTSSSAFSETRRALPHASWSPWRQASSALLDAL